MSPTDGDLYTTPDSYIAALEAHGATAGDIPRMLSTLRRQSERIRELEAGLMSCASMLRGEDIDPDGEDADMFTALAAKGIP